MFTGLFFCLIFTGLIYADSNDTDSNPWLQGMEFGVGRNDVSGELLTAVKAVNWTSDDVSYPICHNNRDIKFVFARDKHELQDTLYLEFALSVNVGLEVKGGVGLGFALKKSDTSVYMAIVADMRNCDYSLNAPALKDDALSLYNSEDYEQFRTSFGDSYLQTITTGGTFVGIMELKISETELNSTFLAFITVKLGPLTLFDKEWKKKLKNFSSDYDTNIELYINGVKNDSANCMTDLIKEYDRFIVRASSDKCTGENGYIECPYKTGYFSSYTEIVDNGRNHESLHERKYKLTLLTRKITEYETVLHNLEMVKKQTEIYSVPAYETLSVKSYADTLEAEAFSDYSSSVDLYRDCKTAPLGSDKCLFDENSFLSSLYDIREKMPIRKLPESCKELKDIYRVNSDDVYKVYEDHDETKEFEVYCEKMDEDVEPFMYLILKKISAPVTSPRYNYSRFVNYKNTSTGKLTTLSTVFRGLLIQKKWSGGYKLITGQSFLIETYGGPIDSSSGFETLEYATVGFGAVCNIEETEYLTENIANIDLNGTSFIFSDSVTKSSIRTGGIGTVDAEVSDDKKSLTIQNLTLPVEKCGVAGSETIEIIYEN